MSEIMSKQSGPVLDIILNRPEAGNAATDGMAAEIVRLVEAAAHTAQLIILRGAGSDFCSGRATMSAPRPAGAVDPLQARHRLDIVFDCYGALRNSAVPVLCVVKGRAMGFGCALAAVSDITIAAEDATFQVPEMMHDILPTMVMSSFVDRVPRKAFNYLVYTSAPVSARRALTFGIVSDVAPASGLEDAVQATAAAILRAPRPAVIGVKEYARRAFDMDVSSAVDYARNLHATINSSAEMRRKH
jgi:enoyl-CoA hydratase